VGTYCDGKAMDQTNLKTPVQSHVSLLALENIQLLIDMRFLRRTEAFTGCYLINCVALEFENLRTLRRFFSESEDRSLDGLAI